MGVFKRRFDSLVRKGIEKNAKRYQVDAERVQLGLFLDRDGACQYATMVDYEVRERMEFLPLLGIRFDFMGVGQLVPPHIQSAMHRLAAAHQISFERICVILNYTPAARGKGKVASIGVHLYKMGAPGEAHQYVKKVQENDLFDDEQIAMEQMGEDSQDDQEWLSQIED